jgi:predicted ABC-type ATPase
MDKKTKLVLIAGPIGSGKKSIAVSLKMAHVPGIQFASYNDETLVQGFTVIPTKTERSPAQVVGSLIQALSNEGQEIKQLVISGNFSEKNIESLSEEFLRIKIVYIQTELVHSIAAVEKRLRYGRHSAGTTDQIHRIWRTHQETTLLSIGRFRVWKGEQNLLLLKHDSPFSVQIRETVKFLDLGKKEKQLLIDRLTLDRTHPAYQYVNEIAREPAIQRIKVAEDMHRLARMQFREGSD